MVQCSDCRSASCAEKEVAQFPDPKGSDPVQKMLEIEDHAEQMRDTGMHVDDQDVYSTCVSALT